MNKRLENIKFLQKVAAGKITPEDLIRQQPGFRIWLNLGYTKMYIGPLINNQPPPKPEYPRYKITLNLSKT